MGIYQTAYNIMCDIYDDHDGDIDAETLIELTNLELEDQGEDPELLPSDWLQEEAGTMCQ